MNIYVHQRMSCQGDGVFLVCSSREENWTHSMLHTELLHFSSIKAVLWNILCPVTFAVWCTYTLHTVCGCTFSMLPYCLLKSTLCVLHILHGTFDMSYFHHCCSPILIYTEHVYVRQNVFIRLQSFITSFVLLHNVYL